MSASRYRLVRTIASGGMAHVYEAVARGERGFERRVAIKRILPQHARDEAMRRMFFDEASIAGRLHHTNVVQVLDFGVVDDDDFIAMEYVDGIDGDRALSLARRRGAAMPEVLALHVVAEVAHALAYAHALLDESGQPLGIVHRDVSPHNVLLSWDGHVKLSDFGIALATGREEKTRTGVVKGKLAYMPLEQAAGGRVTAAADVYALGITLHALASGSPPSESPRARPELDPTLSADVRALVGDCLAVDPLTRPSAADVAERAGRLAARALERDAPGALSTWLASLGAKGKVSALDDLMGLDLVVMESARDDASRHFTVVRAPAPAKDEPVLHASEPSIHLPTKRYGLAASLAIGALAIVGAVLFMAYGADTQESDDASARSIATRSESDIAPATRSAEERTFADASAASNELARARVETSAGIEEVAPPRIRRARHDRTREAVPAPPPQVQVEPTEPPAEIVRSYVRIPRAGDTHERIEIDGRSRGFTPAIVELDAGGHRVVVRSVESGEIVLERDIVVQAQHTRIAPFVVPR